MPRPKLGKAAKSEVGTVRLTEAQKQVLVARHGSVTRALRSFVLSEMEKDR